MAKSEDSCYLLHRWLIFWSPSHGRYLSLVLNCNHGNMMKCLLVTKWRGSLKWPQCIYSLMVYSPGVHTCSRYSSSGNMFSEHVLGTHHFLESERVLAGTVPARTVPAGTWSNHVLGTNHPLSTPPKWSLNAVVPRTCSNGRGLVHSCGDRALWPKVNLSNHSD